MDSFPRDRLMVLTLGSLLLVGCTLFESHSQPTPVVVSPPATVQREQVVVREPVLVRDAPPPPRTEAITVAPSPQHVWAPGYWTRDEGGWTWRSGYWTLRR